MKTRRKTMNEFIINQFLSNDIAGYSANYNGEWYFTLRNSEMYGGKILELRTEMGTRIIQLNEDNVADAAFEIQQTLLNLNKIIKKQKAIDEYCSNNSWTYSGT